MPRTPYLGRACSSNDCYRNKNSLTTAFCQYTTTFNMNTTNTSTRSTLYYITATFKALNLSRRQRQKLRAVTIFQKWPAGSVLKWKGCISAAELRAVSTKLTLLWKDHQFGHAQLSQFGKTDGFHLRKGRCGRLVLPNDKLF